jgi:hypothetical protein
VVPEAARDTGCGRCAVLDTCVISGLLRTGETPVLLEGLSQVARVMQRISYATGETIFHQGAPALGYHILCQGLAKLYARSSLGRRGSSSSPARAPSWEERWRRSTGPPPRR